MQSSLPLDEVPDRRRPDWRARYLAFAAFAYAAFGVIAMFAFAPHVPYADQLRRYVSLLTRSFPIALFATANGHVEVTANLLRFADLHWFGGQEWVQIAGGATLAIASLLALLDTPRRDRDRDLSPSSRAAVAFALAFGIFWLGNARALAQSNDSVHVYSVILCLALALRLALTEQVKELRSLHAIGLAILLCAIASLSFGSGVATFAALIALLFVQRTSWPRLLLAVIGMGCVLAFYLASNGVSTSPTASVAASIAIVRQAMQWLGAPFVYLFWPLLDPAAAAAIPGPIGAVAVDIAGAWTKHFGDIHQSVFPQAACGVTAVVLLLLATFRLRRIGVNATRSARIGAGIAWFGVAVAGLVAFTRQAYFAEHPDQIYAPRYLPWSTLCWVGLLLAFVANVRASRSALTITLLLPVLALPSEFGMALVARHMREVAEDTALAAAVGVLPVDENLGETDIDDLRAALPILRGAGTAMFAWPESALLGRTVPSSATALTAGKIEVDAVVNRLDGTGSQVNAQLVASSCRRERVIVAVDDLVVGLLRRMPDGNWRGVVREHPAGDRLHFFALCAVPSS